MSYMPNVTRRRFNESQESQSIRESIGSHNQSRNGSSIRKNQFKLGLLEWKNKKKEENNDTDSYVDSFEDDDKVSEKEVSYNNLSHSKSKNNKRGSNAKIQSIKGK